MANTLIVGCGEKQVKKFDNCVAIDISENYIKKSKEIKPSNFYLLADANKLPFVNNNFSKVICTEVLEHTKDPNKVLSEISRVLIKGGILYLSVPIAKICEDLAKIFPAYKRDFYEKYHKTNFTKENLIQLLKKNKLEPLKMNYFGKENYYFWHIWAKIVKSFNLDVYIEESGKICLNSNNSINKGLFRNLSKLIKILSLVLSKISNKYTNMHMEAKKC